MCRFLTPFKFNIGTSKLRDFLPPEIWKEKLHLLPVSEQSDVEPKGLDIIFHLFSAVSFKVQLWSNKSRKQLNEEDTNHTFFNRLANSGVLPSGALCRLYVCAFRSGCDLTLLA